MWLLESHGREDLYSFVRCVISAVNIGNISERNLRAYSHREKANTEMKKSQRTSKNDGRINSLRSVCTQLKGAFKQNEIENFL